MHVLMYNVRTSSSCSECNRRPPIAVIIGAGIGGLFAALALSRKGWFVQVFEKSSELARETQGTSITIYPNDYTFNFDIFTHIWVVIEKRQDN